MIYSFSGRQPELDLAECYVAPSAQIIGSVRLGSRSSIWFNAVLRGDSEWIEVGASSNVQDGSVLHADPGVPVVIAPHVSVGHMVMLHGCRIETGSLIGNGAIVLDGAHIGSSCIVASGALVTPGMKIPDGVVVMGAPAKVVRETTPRDLELIAHASAHYVERGAQFREHLRAVLAPGTTL